MIVHKTMTMKDRLALGYAGYLDRAKCDQSVVGRNFARQPWLSRYWKRVTCKRCLRAQMAKVRRSFCK
jgi:hypothetical protein